MWYFINNQNIDNLQQHFQHSFFFSGFYVWEKAVELYGKGEGMSPRGKGCLAQCFAHRQSGHRGDLHREFEADCKAAYMLGHGCSAAHHITKQWLVPQNLYTASVCVLMRKLPSIMCGSHLLSFYVFLKGAWKNTRRNS